MSVRLASLKDKLSDSLSLSQSHFKGLNQRQRVEAGSYHTSSQVPRDLTCRSLSFFSKGSRLSIRAESVASKNRLESVLSKDEGEVREELAFGLLRLKLLNVKCPDGEYPTQFSLQTAF